MNTIEQPRTSPAQKYYEIEKNCEILFEEGRPYWHLFTDGAQAKIIFTNETDFMTGMNFIGICADNHPQVKILTFILMNNHLHMILSGEKEHCEKMFEEISVKIKRLLIDKSQKSDAKDFRASLLEIKSLNMLRSEIVYVNRNAYVISHTYTPCSYPWGAGFLFYNDMFRNIPLTPFDSLKFDKRREICRSRQIPHSPKLQVFRDYIFPSCYCHTEKAQAYFRNVHHYFNMLSKDYEAFSMIAKHLNEKISYCDEDLFKATNEITYSRFNAKNPKTLPVEKKLELTRILHSDYNASNRQIILLLNIDPKILDALYPHPQI